MMLFVKSLDLVECCLKPGCPCEIDHVWMMLEVGNGSFPECCDAEVQEPPTQQLSLKEEGG